MKSAVFKLWVVFLLCLAGQAPAADLPVFYPQAGDIFPDAEGYGEFEGTPPSVAVLKGGTILGYLFLSNDVLRIPAYSGKPINTLVGIDLHGRIAGLSIVHHDEPILAVGITPETLNRYVAQYAGKSAFDKIVIGARRKGHVAIDGITGATITVMVENATVMRSAKMVADARGIHPPERQHPSAVPVAAIAAQAPPAKAQHDPAQEPGAAVPKPPSPDRVRDGAAPIAKPAAVADAPSAATKQPPSARAKPVVAPPASTPHPFAAPPLPGRPGTWAPPQEEPVWVAIWQNRAFEISVLMVGLATLFTILIFQDWLARHPTALTHVRNAFHVYTLFFIGWYGLAQLSVINVLTFTHSVMSGFRWEHFLIDPMMFILWGFVAITLLLWGRGVYCGWLCPFGALQELILIAARKLRLPELEFSDAVHERLVALKYIILILLFGVSLQSIAEAAWYAEIEPFKTAISMRFQRDWEYVLYVLVLLGLAAVNRKFYCKYLCPLGAALSIPGRFRLFEWWLRRRKECGKPCQVCANRCSVRAIRPTGEINANECHYCLDCQVIYYSDKACVPLIERRKRREPRQAREQDGKANIHPIKQMDAQTGANASPPAPGT